MSPSIRLADGLGRLKAAPTNDGPESTRPWTGDESGNRGIFRSQPVIRLEILNEFAVFMMAHKVQRRGIQRRALWHSRASARF